MTAGLGLDRVDWLAVEFVCNGTPMKLDNDPATLEAAILSMGYGITAAQVAERCGTNSRRVARTLLRAGAVTCPFCNRYIVTPTGVLPHHVLAENVRCAMSGGRVDDEERCQLMRNVEKKARGRG